MPGEGKDGWKRLSDEPVRSRYSMKFSDQVKAKSTRHRGIVDEEMKLMRDNPDKTLGDLVQPETIKKRVMRDLRILEDVHRNAIAGDAHAAKILQSNIRDFLGPDIAYLKERDQLPEDLPEDLKRMDFEKHFTLKKE